METETPICFPSRALLTGLYPSTTYRANDAMATEDELMRQISMGSSRLRKVAVDETQKKFTPRTGRIID